MTQEYIDLQNDMKRIEQLRTAYDNACNAYLAELLRMWDLDGRYGYWDNNRPGTVYHYGETHDLSMNEIIYIFEHSVTEDEVLAWEDYCMDALEFGFSLPTLDEWCHGCPRTDEAVFKRLRQMKRDLEAAVDEEISRLHEAKGGTPAAE